MKKRFLDIAAISYLFFNTENDEKINLISKVSNIDELKEIASSAVNLFKGEKY